MLIVVCLSPLLKPLWTDFVTFNRSKTLLGMATLRRPNELGVLHPRTIGSGLDSLKGGMSFFEDDHEDEERRGNIIEKTVLGSPKQGPGIGVAKTVYSRVMIWRSDPGD